MYDVGGDITAGSGYHQPSLVLSVCLVHRPSSDICMEQCSVGGRRGGGGMWGREPRNVEGEGGNGCQHRAGEGYKYNDVSPRALFCCDAAVWLRSAPLKSASAAIPSSLSSPSDLLCCCCCCCSALFCAAAAAAAAVLCWDGRGGWMDRLGCLARDRHFDYHIFTVRWETSYHTRSHHPAWACVSITAFHGE